MLEDEDRLSSVLRFDFLLKEFFSEIYEEKHCDVIEEEQDRILFRQEISVKIQSRVYFSQINYDSRFFVSSHDECER
jgi:hypothetical protein